MVERIEHEGTLLALIVRANFKEPGIHFFTPDNFSQQLAYMRYGTGKVIPPHVHNVVHREVHFTQEVLLIRSGKLRVDFYTQDKTYLESRILAANDLILLSEGGHGFEVLEPLEMIEVKQGPYAGENDKVRFQPIASHRVTMGPGEGLKE